MNQKSSRLSQEARQHLLRRVETMQHSTALRASERESKDRVSFANLPGYDELRLFRSIGQKFGVENPYFRLHEARAGSQTRIGGKSILNFSSYDYLGLNEHPEVVQTGKAAIDRYGISASASRHVAGERPVHRALEHALADHYGVEDCLVLVSGYATNLGVIGHLVGSKDLLVHDALSHNSIVMGGTLSGAARRSFAHNDLDSLDQMLAATRNKFERALIVVEGHYSMDGDYPDLPRLLEIKARHRRLADGRRGRIPSACSGGAATASPSISASIRGGSTSGWEPCPRPSPDAAATSPAARSSSTICDSPSACSYSASACRRSSQRPPTRRSRFCTASPSGSPGCSTTPRYFCSLAKARGLDLGTAAGTAVCPVIIGDSLPTVVLSQRLLERGVNALPVTHPAVPAKSSRLRFFVTAMHTRTQIEAAIDVTAEELANVRERAAEFDLTHHA